MYCNNISCHFNETKEARRARIELLTADPVTAALQTLNRQLCHMIGAARRNELNFDTKLVDRDWENLGQRVLYCATKYARGEYPDRRVRDLWEAYGAWQEHVRMS